jgi:Skp family chaperone for outer membrane proteins
MAFGIDVKGITAKLDEKFAQMMTELQAIRSVLMQILAQLQKEKP